MSEIFQKEFASAFKWTWVIIVAAIAYNLLAPNYFFTKQGSNHLRGHKVTGRVEVLTERGWINMDESEHN